MQLFNRTVVLRPCTNRRDRVVVCGEKRSANRTSWTRSEHANNSTAVLERPAEENASDLVSKDGYSFDGLDRVSVVRH
jgi:hypothetical protein